MLELTAKQLINLNITKQDLVQALMLNLRGSKLSKLEAAQHALFHYKALKTQMRALGHDLRDV